MLMCGATLFLHSTRYILTMHRLLFVLRLLQHWVGICGTFSFPTFDQVDGHKCDIQTVCFGLYEMNGKQSSEDFQKIVADALGEYNVLMGHLHTAVTDNCGKETKAARLIMADAGKVSVACYSKTCQNHTLGLVITHAMGDKEYKTSSKDADKMAEKANKNNPKAAKLLTKARALSGHFRRSGQATGKLNDYQLIDIQKPVAVWPFTCKALQLHPAKRAKTT